MAPAVGPARAEDGRSRVLPPDDAARNARTTGVTVRPTRAAVHARDGGNFTELRENYLRRGETSRPVRAYTALQPSARRKHPKGMPAHPAGAPASGGPQPS